MMQPRARAGTPVADKAFRTRCTEAPDETHDHSPISIATATARCHPIGGR
jgi:hypothetical protein